jgi:hypothetical protein
MENGLLKAFNINVLEWKATQQLNYEQVPFMFIYSNEYGHFTRDHQELKQSNKEKKATKNKKEKIKDKSTN